MVEKDEPEAPAWITDETQPIPDALADQLGFEAARRQYLKGLALSGKDDLPDFEDLPLPRDAEREADTASPEPDNAPDIEP